MPDLEMIFPSEPIYDIPWLLPDMQAQGVALPYKTWGSVGRTKQMPGTYFFYTDDRHFNKLLVEPSQILASGCQVAVEPNISCSLASPRALVIAQVFKKRYVNRYWQSLGLQTIVDVNVPVEFQDLVLLGVPHSWRIYATRGYSAQPEAVLAEYELARYHADGDITFIVYAGGKDIEKLCKANGWVYLEDDQDVARGRKGYTPTAKQLEKTKVARPVTV